MASGVATALKMATAATCIMLVLLSMAASPVTGTISCPDTCRVPCENFAAGFCGTGSSSSKLCPSVTAQSCRDTAFEICDAACVDGCDEGNIVPCL
ncbi:unnamed protein product [Urochloa decumbens]|uniref:Uncharacterized protein n=1 Tax=Urochloa decumbens TaxID=240449 RepID=A0ABC8VJS6_9POAL